MNTILNSIKFVRNVLNNLINWKVCKDNGYTFCYAPDDRWYEIINKWTNIDKKTIKMKDEKGTEVEFDPLKVQVYEASPDETDITKILPADFSDINEKLLLDIVPQNKLVLVNDNNNQPVIIKKKEGDNLVKYPKTSFDTFVF